jgi:hypothetical protein
MAMEPESPQVDRQSPAFNPKKPGRPRSEKVCKVCGKSFFANRNAKSCDGCHLQEIATEQEKMQRREVQRALHNEAQKRYLDRKAEQDKGGEYYKNLCQLFEYTRQKSKPLYKEPTFRGKIGFAADELWLDWFERIQVFVEAHGLNSLKNDRDSHPPTHDLDGLKSHDPLACLYCLWAVFDRGTAFMECRYFVQDFLMPSLDSFGEAQRRFLEKEKSLEEARISANLLQDCSKYADSNGTAWLWDHEGPEAVYEFTAFISDLESFVKENGMDEIQKQGKFLFDALGIHERRYDAETFFQNCREYLLKSEAIGDKVA